MSLQALPDRLADCLPAHHSLVGCTHLFKYIPHREEGGGGEGGRGRRSCKKLPKIKDHLVLCCSNLFHALDFI